MSRSKALRHLSPAIPNTNPTTKSTIDIAALTARHAFKYAELQRTAQRLLSGYNDSKPSKAGGEHGRGGPAAGRMVKDGERDDDDDNDDDDSELWNVEDETAGLGSSKPATTTITSATATTTSTAALRRKLLGPKRPSHHTLTPRPPPTSSTIPEKRFRPGQGRGGRDGRAVDDDSSGEEATERKGRPRHTPPRTNEIVKRKRGLQRIQQTPSPPASHGPGPEKDKGDEHDDDDRSAAKPAPAPPTTSDPNLKTDGQEGKPDQDGPTGMGGEDGTQDGERKKATGAGGGARYLDVLLAERAAAKKKRKRRKKGQGAE